jgi:pimeloyl-ACP methyl ester carboxylesterase
MVMNSKLSDSPTHPAEMHDVYERMLRDSGASGRFVILPGPHRVHVIEGGTGTPVVHLHGNNTSSLSHLMLLKHDTSVRSYLVDRPGMGLSDAWPFPTGSFREFATGFVDDVLDALELESAVLVGNSGGGVYATWYALAHPDRVRGLVMVGSTPTLPGSRPPVPLRLVGVPFVGGLMTRAMRPSRETLVRLLASVGERDTITAHADLLDSLVVGAKDRVAVAANRAEFRALLSPWGVRAAARIEPEDLRRLSVPVLMIWGARDPVVPVADARAAAQQIPVAHLEVLDAGHVPQLGHPARVARLVSTFARDLASPRRAPDAGSRS